MLFLPPAEDADMVVHSPCTTPKKGTEEVPWWDLQRELGAGSDAGVEGFRSGLLCNSSREGKAAVGKNPDIC